MGSYNGTCGITQLPLFRDQEVVAFILSKNDEEGGTGVCYANSLWQPITLPLYGKYNDYGGIEFSEESSKLFDIFLRETENTIRIKNENEDPEFFSVGRNSEVFWDNLHRDNLTVNVPYSGYNKVALYLIDREIYDSMIKADFDFHGITQVNLEIVKNKFVSLFDKLKSVKGDIRKTFNILYNEREDRFVFSLESQTHRSYCQPFDFKYYLEHHEKYEDFDLLIDRLSEWYMLNCFMCMTRKQYCIQGGAGSQTEALELHEILAKKILKRIDDRNKYFDEDGDYEEWELETPLNPICKD